MLTSDLIFYGSNERFKTKFISQSLLQKMPISKIFQI